MRDGGEREEKWEREREEREGRDAGKRGDREGIQGRGLAWDGVGAGGQLPREAGEVVAIRAAG